MMVISRSSHNRADNSSSQVDSSLWLEGRLLGERAIEAVEVAVVSAVVVAVVSAVVVAVVSGVVDMDTLHSLDTTTHHRAIFQGVHHMLAFLGLQVQLVPPQLREIPFLIRLFARFAMLQVIPLPCVLLVSFSRLHLLLLLRPLMLPRWSGILIQVPRHI